jgi:hypothetical protein
VTAPARFRQSDIERAAKAVRKAGYDGARILIDPKGRLEIIFGEGVNRTAPNPWDEIE